MQIPEEVINEVRDRADIVDVVSRFVDLRRTGVNYKAVCPFHEEKTPSFVVSPDKQIFHCFGCGRGGNVFSFLMEIEGVSFPEAVRSLGNQYGVEVPDRQRPTAGDSRKEGFYRLSDFAARWYHRNLMEGEQGEPARKYLIERSIPKESWVAYQLGYAGPGWDQFYAAASRKQAPIGDLRALKLVVAREQSSGYFDYFRKRIMFPISTLSGRVVAFGARTLEADVEPKYLNSVESDIYAKRKILYGLPQAREAIRAKRTAILVEGYTDCISLYNNGMKNSVASCGTAITPDHASLLRRLTRRVVLMPDADTAGMDAALLSGSIFMAAGLDVGVVVLDEGMDPDTAARKLGGEKIEKNVGGAMEYLQYLDYIMKVRPMSPRDKEAVIDRVTAGLNITSDPLRYEVLLQDLSRVLKVDPDGLRRRRPAARTSGSTAGAREPRPSAESLKRAELEKMLLRLLLEITPEAAEAREKLDSDDFSQENSREFYKLLDSAWENHIDIGSSVFQQRAEAAGLEGFAAEISLISFPPGNPGLLLKDTVRRVKELQIRDELNVLREKLQELPEESEEAVAVAEHYARLKRALSEL